MQRKLTSATTLDNLRREARRWLKGLRENQSEALQRFERAYPNHTRTPVLRDVQYALACEYGFENWKELKAGRSAGGAARTSEHTNSPRGFRQRL